MTTSFAVSASANERPFRLHAVPDYTPDVRRLSRDDLRLLGVIATGVPINSVAFRLGRSDRTVRRRVRVICETLGVRTMIEAVVWAARRGLI